MPLWNLPRSPFPAFIVTHYSKLLFRTIFQLSRRWYFLPCFTVLLFLLCEFFIYYFAIFSCSWPLMKCPADSSQKLGTAASGTISSDTFNTPVQAVILSDPHLLSKYAHWLDKLRREWQMRRSFQTALQLLQPEVVFILGDIFDNGQNSADDDFRADLLRFQSMFHAKIPVISAVGNHDIGFHYRIFPALRRRFEKAFNCSPVQLIEIKGVNIVLLNSMAFEADGCSMCKEAESMLKNISDTLRCRMNKALDSQFHGLQPATKKSNCLIRNSNQKYVRPIVMQHFPMYRPSDEACEDVDSAPEDEKRIVFREKWECLSRNATEMVLSELNPRAVFSGHTHHSCYRQLSNGAGEWSVASFNWRNKVNPSFLTVSMCPDYVGIAKCFLPHEHTVFTLYACGGVVWVLWVLSRLIRIRDCSRGRFPAANLDCI